MKKRTPWIYSAFLLVLPLTSLAPRAAHADVYHSVETGDTLSSISSKYRVSSEVLRSVNKLNASYSDSDALPTMLLRVPDGSSAAFSVASTTRSQSSAAISPSFASSKPRTSIPTNSSEQTSTHSSYNKLGTVTTPVASGSVSKSFLYVVQAGDTVESIAQRHTEFGYPVTAQAIRNKNTGVTTLIPGRSLIIPLGTVQLNNAVKEATTFRSSAFKTIATSDDSLPAPQVAQAPLYETTRSAPRASSQPTAIRRGPTALGSRSYTPSSGQNRAGNRLEGAQVLDPSQDANVTGTPLSRMRSRTAAAPIAAPAVKPSAQVARVALRGARIRRLPDINATTLYNCTPGTEIAVTKRNGEWSAILMSDRSTGWIPTRYLRFTGQSVDVSTQVVAAASFGANTNYSVRSASGRWTSTHPVVAQALSWLGTPYVYGGSSRRGIDCSAMIQNSFRSCGYRLPRTAAQQSKVGQRVEPANLQPGDRLYFSASGTRVDHTGLYMGNGLFVHASGSGRSVIVSNLFDKRNWNIFVGARR